MYRNGKSSIHIEASLKILKTSCGDGLRDVFLSENLTSERCFSTIAAAGVTSVLKTCGKISYVFLKSTL